MFARVWSVFGSVTMTGKSSSRFERRASKKNAMATLGVRVLTRNRVVPPKPVSDSATAFGFRPGSVVHPPMAPATLISLLQNT